MLDGKAWKPVTAGGILQPAQSGLFTQILTIADLHPDTAYELRASDGSTAKFNTLPAHLPAADQQGLTVLLSSCFHVDRDGGEVGKAVTALPESFQPKLKILCGDQVYLDQPTFQDFPNNKVWLADKFLRSYIKTWSQHGTAGEGYQSLLARGGTYFTADDHEFWNNYPNWTTLVNNSWTGKGKDNWENAALALYREFQTDAAAQAGHPRELLLDNLSFFIADTRIFRKEGNSDFMTGADFNNLKSWITNRPGPGVLVIGQPVFDKPAGWLASHFADRSIANYAQYKELVTVLFQSKHSLVVLTGDVHFGRVASCELKGGAKPVRLFEVIASPAALVDPKVGGKSSPAPPRFPHDSIPGITSSPTSTSYVTVEDHFVTLQFSQRAGAVRVQVRYWFPRRRIGAGVTYQDAGFIDL